MSKEESIQELLHFIGRMERFKETHGDVTAQSKMLTHDLCHFALSFSLTSDITDSSNLQEPHTL